MTPLSRRAFLGTLAAIPAAAFMPLTNAPVCGFVPVDTRFVLMVAHDGLIRVPLVPWFEDTESDPDLPIVYGEVSDEESLTFPD